MNIRRIIGELFGKPVQRDALPQDMSIEQLRENLKLKKRQLELLDDPDTFCSFGEMSYDGDGVEQDYCAAANWFKMAADAGHLRASKLMVVDGIWSLIGSANWDARSLRLNFEFNVEAYDADLAASLTAIAESKIVNSTAVTLNSLRNRPILYRLRDGFARVASPYL
jgi:phosphatidylserine/phosphatidylglycerophosphate/cardiolipin synthase-like enzyme